MEKGPSIVLRSPREVLLWAEERKNVQISRTERWLRDLLRAYLVMMDDIDSISRISTPASNLDVLVHRAGTIDLELPSRM